MTNFVPEISWEMILNTAFLRNGSEWFRDPGEPITNDVTAAEAAEGFGFELTKSDIPETRGYSKYFIHAREGDDGKPRAGWSRQWDYVKAKTLQESRLSPRVQKAFRELGLNINSFPQGEDATDFVGLWINEYEIPFVQYGQFYETADGTEFMTWNVDIFLNSKRMSDLPADSWALKIPSLVEAMMYLAEAPLKQSWLPMSRSASSAFKGVAAKNIPHPGIAFNEGGYAMVVNAQHEGQLGLELFTCPTTISASYDIAENLDDEELKIVLETVSNSFVSLSTQTVTAFDSKNHTEETGLMDLWEATGISVWTDFPDGRSGNLLGPNGIFIAACHNWQDLANHF
jgi:hypothetical protein